MNKTKSSGTDAPVRNERSTIEAVQNMSLIWLDNNINDTSTDYRNTINQFRWTVNEINTFTDVEECIQFIDNIVDNKACMIISSSFGQQIVPEVHNMFQVDSIFILCDNQKYNKQWTKEWPKIKGVFTEITAIWEALKQATQQCEQSAISISFVATGDADISKKNLDQLDPIYMYTQILKEILLTITFDDGHIKGFIDYCQEAFTDNDRQLKNVDQLQAEYHQKTPIWWYTCEIFLYPMLNQCLRLMNMDVIIKMGFFITDLHRQIEQLHSEQFDNSTSRTPFVVYRGQGMSKIDFEQMIKIQGGLISFNSFLSTSKDREVSYVFAESSSTNPDLIGILFIMSIDPKKSTTPFASIIDVGYFGNKENEVLFSMHSVFRIGEIKCIGDNQRLFQVNLTLTDDNDKDLRLLTDHIREETYSDKEGWLRLGLLLLKAGESVIASQVYETLLEQTNDMDKQASIYHQLGIAKCDKGEYRESIIFHKKSLEFSKKFLPPTHLDLANCHSSIGNVYYKMGNYSKALLSHEKALEILKQTLPLNHSNLATSYNNTGGVYYNMGDYQKALLSHEKALEMWKQSLPSNHPSLAMSYNNIGSVYSKMVDYPKALSYYEKALEIRKQSLPTNHPSLASSYNNIGVVYYGMGDYQKALSSLEKALETWKESLPSNHPHLATSYNSIGNVYSDMGDHQKALLSHEKALEMWKQSLPSNHPDLAMSYNNIGLVYENMNNYARALSFYELAVEIGQQSLPISHPNLQTYKKNLDIVKNKL